MLHTESVRFYPPRELLLLGDELIIVVAIMRDADDLSDAHLMELIHSPLDWSNRIHENQISSSLSSTRSVYSDIAYYADLDII